MELSAAALLLPAGGVLLAGLITAIFWPGKLLKIVNWVMRRRLGLTVRYCLSGSYRFCYSSRGPAGGDAPALLLLHGFSGSKDNWLPVVKFLPKHLHVVCLDMPGHEGTSRPHADDYSIENQVHRVHQFVESVGLAHRPFHLVGISMGGNVAGVFAARHPAHLASLTLMCPAGVDSPRQSRFVSHLKQVEQSQDQNQDQSILLIPSSVPELRNMLEISMFKPPNVHAQILRGFLENRKVHNGFYKEVLVQIVAEKSRYSLQENMHLITAPLLVIWGKDDQVLDVSGASVLQGALPGCRVELLDRCGHSVMMERPRKSTKLLVDFISEQEDAKKCS